MGRIRKRWQLLDWPFTRLLFESLYIKKQAMSCRLKVMDFSPGIAYFLLVDARPISNCYRRLSKRLYKHS